MFLIYVLYVHLRVANTYIQIILNPCAMTTYCMSYMTKIDKSIAYKLCFVIKK